MIEKCTGSDIEEIAAIINDSSSAYRGVIPEDLWHEPYMSHQELTIQIAQGVEFWKVVENRMIQGIMGIQKKHDVTLIRHAYVRTAFRNKGIGSKLLAHLLKLADKPVLIGTWADAHWAIEFYRRHGFRLLLPDQTAKLLETYWEISARQAETSVVLASPEWSDEDTASPLSDLRSM